MRVFSPWLALLAVLPGPALALSPCEMDGSDPHIRAFLLDYFTSYYFNGARPAAEANIWMNVLGYRLLGEADGALSCEATVVVRAADPHNPAEVGGARGALRFQIRIADPPRWTIETPDGAAWTVLATFHRDHL